MNPKKPASDPSTTTVQLAAKCDRKREVDLPEYKHFVRKRSARGGHVTNELVAKLLGNSG